MRARQLLSLLLAALVTACFETTVRSGLPPADPAPGHHARWHHAFMFGLLEASGPYDLAELCPHGWSEIQTESDPVHGLLLLLSVGIYAPARVTVICAEPPGPDLNTSAPPDPVP
jgi:hypothetical protein